MKGRLKNRKTGFQTTFCNEGRQNAFPALFSDYHFPIFQDRTVSPFGQPLQNRQETSAEIGQRIFRPQRRPAAEYFARDQPALFQLLELTA